LTTDCTVIITDVIFVVANSTGFAGRNAIECIPQAAAAGCVVLAKKARLANTAVITLASIADCGEEARASNTHRRACRNCIRTNGAIDTKRALFGVGISTKWTGKTGSVSIRILVGSRWAALEVRSIPIKSRISDT